MKLRAGLSILLMANGLASIAQSGLTKKLDTYSTRLTLEVSQIPSDRRAALDKLAEQIIASRDANGKANIVFVSQDNATNSQLAQIWMQAAAQKYHLKGINITSAGNEATSLSNEAIEALKTAGFKVENTSNFRKNPRYTVQYSRSENPILAFSKKLNNYQIPTSNVIAVVSDRETAVPALPGEVSRVEVGYAANDGARIIGREMLYLAEKIQTSQLLSLKD